MPGQSGTMAAAGSECSLEPINAFVFNFSALVTVLVTTVVDVMLFDNMTSGTPFNHMFTGTLGTPGRALLLILILFEVTSMIWTEVVSGGEAWLEDLMSLAFQAIAGCLEMVALCGTVKAVRGLLAWRQRRREQTLQKDDC